MKKREPLRGQWSQGRSLNVVKQLAHLLADRAVNPRVSYGRFPLLKMNILGRQAGEAMPLQPIVLNVVDAAFDLAFVTRR